MFHNVFYLNFCFLLLFPFLLWCTLWLSLLSFLSFALRFTHVCRVTVFVSKWFIVLLHLFEISHVVFFFFLCPLYHCFALQKCLISIFVSSKQTPSSFSSDQSLTYPCFKPSVRVVPRRVLMGKWYFGSAYWGHLSWWAVWPQSIPMTGWVGPTLSHHLVMCVRVSPANAWASNIIPAPIPALVSGNVWPSISYHECMLWECTNAWTL